MKAQGLQYILLGFVLVIFGAIVPFLIVIGVISVSFWVCILAYSASVIGLFLGMFGAFDIRQEELD
jgi:heme/copper-type cytochrome/quinol oxidase subunit 4